VKRDAKPTPWAMKEEQLFKKRHLGFTYEKQTGSSHNIIDIIKIDHSSS
jgi:hypothetical protein